MSKYDEIDLVNDANSINGSVNSTKNALDNSVENANSFSEINKWTEVYNNPESTLEQKQYAGVQIMNAFFSLGERNVPPEIGNALFGLGNELINDFESSEGKHLFENRLNEAYLKEIEINPDSEKAKALFKMLNDVDASYEAYKIAVAERCAQDFPSSSTEWDNFYASYQENNDPDEIMENVASVVEKPGHALAETIVEKFPEVEEWVMSTSEGIDNFKESAKKEWEEFIDSMEQIADGWRDVINTLRRVVYDKLNSVRQKAGNAAKTKYDPLILDLDGDGYNVETKENGANFDLDKNGFAEKINWTSRDGFLCLDLNGNGMIDDGGELFGDQTLLADGTAA